MTNLDRKLVFDELTERNRGRLTAIARSYARNELDDLVQEILLQLWRALPGFKEQSNIDTWCYRVALNTAISWTRSNSTRKKRLPSSETDAGEIAKSVDGQDSFELLNEFLKTLSESDRAIVLMYLEDMTGEEMASVLGISSGGRSYVVYHWPTDQYAGRVGSV